MNDDVIRVLVARGTYKFGAFYLSFVEFLLKDGRFRADDWGWVEGMGDWEPLSVAIKNAREIVGKKRLATSGQREYLRRCNFEFWKGISNREASKIIDSVNDARNYPPGVWIGERLTDDQLKHLANLRVELNPGKATPKQIAYLKHMGFEHPSDMMFDEASQAIESIFDHADPQEILKIMEKNSEWGIERFIQYPDLYAREIEMHRKHVLAERVKVLRDYVRSRVFGGSEPLTAIKIMRVIESLQDESPQWWQFENYKSLFFQRLAYIYPACVDGTPKI